MGVSLLRERRWKLEKRHCEVSGRGRAWCALQWFDRSCVKRERRLCYLGRSARHGVRPLYAGCTSQACKSYTLSLQMEWSMTFVSQYLNNGANTLTFGANQANYAAGEPIFHTYGLCRTHTIV